METRFARYYLICSQLNLGVTRLLQQHIMAHPLRLETSRLVLRPLTAEDFEPFYARLVCDPVVMAFYHAYAAPLTEGDRRARAQRDFFDHFADGHARFGYVCWAVTARAPIADASVGDLLGWAGIVTPALGDPALGPELAYMLAASLCGRGLATEAAGAVLADAYRRYGVAAVHAVVDAPNGASRRILEKLGFADRGQVRVYSSDEMILYTHAESGTVGDAQCIAV